MRLNVVRITGTFLGFGFLLIAGLRAQNCDPGVLSCTPEFDLGRPGLYDDFVQDLAYRPATHEVWAIEGPLPGRNDLQASRITIYSEDLSTARRQINSSINESGFGIAEVPAGFPNALNMYVLTPGTFPGPGSIIPQPRIGIIDNQGNQLTAPEAAFIPVKFTNGQDAFGFFTALDVEPTNHEFALLDDGRLGNLPQIIFASTTPQKGNQGNLFYPVLRGPFNTDGLGTFFGGGITYDTPDTVLVVSQFRSNFEASLALRYDRRSGLYTGQLVDLSAVAGGLPPVTIGIEAGAVAGAPALFTYNVNKDALYAVPLEYQTAPPPVLILDPSCVVMPDGHVYLSWQNPFTILGSTIDEIAIFENGVQVASLPKFATQYTSTNVPQGKYTYCIKTRAGSKDNVLEECCEGQSAETPPYLATGTRPSAQVFIDPLPNHLYQTGMAAPPVVEKKEDFRLYIIGAYDNTVTVVDSNLQVLTDEAIGTNPPEQSVLDQNGNVNDHAVTGIALVDLTIQGQKVPMYALLDGDGPGQNFVPRAGIHFLKDITLPGNGGSFRKGDLYQAIDRIDLGSLNGQSHTLLDWDADPNGDFLAVDYAALRLVKIHYDPQDATMAAVGEVDLPMGGLSPFTGAPFPIGGVSVLPSGHYLVLGGDVFDDTINRSFLMTPFGNDPTRDLPEFVGYEEGYLTFSQLFPYEFLGRALGPYDNWGFDTTFFSGEGEGGKGAGVAFYNELDYQVSRRWFVQGEQVVGLTTSAVHPKLAAEQVVDKVSTVAPGSFDSAPAVASFASRATDFVYHCHVFNPSVADVLTIDLKAVIDGVDVDGTIEEGLVLPPGRSLYRRVAGNGVKPLVLHVNQKSGAPRDIRILIGATGLASAPPPEPKFRRGDVDMGGAVELTDAILTLNFLFLGAGAPTCMDAADVDDDGVVGLTDAIVTLNFLFLAGAPPAPPGPTSCGDDVNADSLPACAGACP